MSDVPVIIDKDYAALIQDIKSQVKSAQLKAHNEYVLRCATYCIS